MPSTVGITKLGGPVARAPGPHGSLRWHWGALSSRGAPARVRLRLRLLTPTVAPTPATYSAELCSAAAEFQEAANAIVTLNATAVGADGVKNALQGLETAATNLLAAAQDQFGPQGAELEKAIASLRGTIAGLTDQDSLSTNLGKIAASVAVVEQAAKPIVDSVRTGCPSVPAVETPPTS